MNDPQTFVGQFDGLQDLGSRKQLGDFGVTAMHCYERAGDLRRELHHAPIGPMPLARQTFRYVLDT